MPKKDTKYPRELIFQVMMEYQERTRSVKELAEYYEVPYNTVKYWAKKYNKFGIEAFYPRKKRNYITYAPVFKIRIVEYWLAHPELSTYEIADQFHVSRSAARNWRRKYLEEGVEALFSEERGRKPMMKKKSDTVASPKSPQVSLEELEKKVYELQMENDYLKKLNALVQEKERLQKKKK